MKSLSTLIKLQKTRVDEQRVILARLQQQLDGIDKKIAALESSKAREQIAVRKNPEGSLTYGEFLRRSVELARELEKQRELAAKAVEIARDRLAELFEEQKRYEIAEAARLEQKRLEELRRETIELDEIGSVTHERRKRKAQGKR